MTPLQKSVISTIAFYDAVGKVPLTSIELYKYLLRTDQKDAKASFHELLEKLENNWPELSPYLNRYRGFYFLKNNPHGYYRRIHVGKTSIKKWQIARRITKIISFLPFVRMVAITGSLAFCNATPKSDIDLLIVAEKGRIWTTRMFVSAIIQVIGKRRHGSKIADRICLNHYLSDANLALRPEHIFSAHICATFMPIGNRNCMAETILWHNRRLIQANFQNLWGLAMPAPALVSVESKNFIMKTFWGRMEALAKAIQVKKIKDNISNGRVYEGEIIFDDEALVFHHPRPKRQEALYLYEENLQELGL